MAEEIGFIGLIVVLTLFCVLVWRGIRVAIMAPDLFGSLLALGITTLLAIQTLFNIAVVTAVIPVTGVSLPFFSYGGTSMILFLGQIGILLNISKSAHVDSVLPANELAAAQNLYNGFRPITRAPDFAAIARLPAQSTAAPPPRSQAANATPLPGTQATNSSHPPRSKASNTTPPPHSKETETPQQPPPVS